MSYGSWEDVIRVYETIYSEKELITDSEKPPTFTTRMIATHSTAMLRLIPMIRAESQLEGLIPYTSHASLGLRSPDVEARAIRIFYDAADTIHLEVDSGGDEALHREVVTEAEFLPRLINLTEKFLHREPS